MGGGDAAAGPGAGGAGAPGGAGGEVTRPRGPPPPAPRRPAAVTKEDSSSPAAGAGRRGRRAEVLAPGSRGDFLPALGLARALGARGLEVRLACHAGFLAEARAALAGVGAARTLSGADPVESRGGAGASGATAEKLWATTRREYLEALEWVGTSGVVVFNFFSSPVLHLLESSGVQGVALLQQPLLPSPARPHFLFADPKMRRCLGPLAATAAAKRRAGRPRPTGVEEKEAFLNLCSYPAAEAILWLPFRGPLEAWRAERGLPAAPGGGHFQLLREHLRVPVVYTFSRELLGGAGEAGTSAARADSEGNSSAWYCGACEPPLPAPSPSSELREFLAPGGAQGAGSGAWRQGLAYVGFGSSARALRRPENALGIVQGLVVAGFKVVACERLWNALPGDTSRLHPLRREARVHACGFVPFQWLFEQLDLVVHHGGGGTFAAACAAGVPQLIAPVEFDQSFWAARGQALGVAPAPLHAAAADAALSAATVSAALGEAAAPQRRVRARELAARLRRETGHGAFAAADKILATLYGPVPGPPSS